VNIFCCMRCRHRYKKLNKQALQLLKPGGVLVTCSCSSAMTLSGTFIDTVHAAARDAGRSVTLLRKEGAAPDHTLWPSCKEGEYLTALFFIAD
jgi:23S rRNA G2069 N7-methylase RlmK/C1962 C5-methylase RlmI